MRRVLAIVVVLIDAGAALAYYAVPGLQEALLLRTRGVVGEWANADGSVRMEFNGDIDFKLGCGQAA